MKNWGKIAVILLAVILGIAVGFFIGRSTIDIPEPQIKREIIRKPGKQIVKVISRPVPYAVHDTTEVPVPSQVDTTALFAVWRDYYRSRDYELDFSDDSLGVFKVKANVQENKITNTEAIIQPNEVQIVETKTIYKVKTLQGYVMLGTSVDFKTNQVQAGIDIKQRWLVGASALRMNDVWGYTINVGIKF